MSAPRLTQQQIDLIVELREKGWGYERIAKKIGRSASAISWHCLKHAADPPKPQRLYPDMAKTPIVKRGEHVVRRYTPEEDQRLLTLERQGLNHTKIGRALGRTPSSITGRLMTLARRDRRMEDAS
jgi:transcriptional regulator